MLEVYTYSSCDTCRRAVRWLRAREIDFLEKPIRETPPSAKQLRLALTAVGGERRRIFNTAGRDYREQKLGERLGGLTDTEAIALLASNGNLVKRPFVSGAGIHLSGFDETAWSAAFGC